MTLIYISLITLALCVLIAIGANVWRDYAKGTQGRRDDLLAPVLRNIAISGILAGTALYIAHDLGYDVRAAFAGLGIGGLIIAFGLQPIIKNFLAGCMLITKAPYNLGHYIKVAGKEGIVQEITFTNTTLRTGRRHVEIIPNAVIVTSPITNCSDTIFRPIETDIIICPNTEQDTVMSWVILIKDAIQKIADTYDDKAPYISSPEIYLRKWNETGYHIRVLVYFNTYSKTSFKYMRAKVMYAVAEISEELEIPLAGAIDVNLTNLTPNSND